MDNYREDRQNKAANAAATVANQPAEQPKKRKPKQKRSLSKQGSSVPPHSSSEIKGTDPAQFAAHAEFSPVTPPDTPGTLGSYPVPPSTHKATVVASDAKTRIPAQSYMQTWTVHGPLPGHPSAKTIQHGASGQFSSFVVTCSHGPIASTSQEWSHSTHHLQQFHDTQKALAKPTMGLTETALATQSPKLSTGPSESLPVPHPQQLSSPSQPLHFNIQSLVYKASPSPARTESSQAPVNRGENSSRKSQPSSDLRPSKGCSALETQSSSLPIYEVKKELSPQIKVTSPHFSPGFLPSGFDPSFYAHLLGSSHVTPLAPSQYRPQGIGAAGFAAPGKASYVHPSTSASIASLYPHIHSSPQVNPQTMLSGKQQLMLSALTMGTQRKTVSSGDPLMQETAKRPSSTKSTSSSLQNPSSLSPPKQLSLVIPPPQQQASRQKSEGGSEEKLYAAIHSRQLSSDSRGHDGSFSPLTPTDSGLREPITGGVPVRKTSATLEPTVQSPSALLLQAKISPSHATSSSSKTFPYAALVQKTICSPNIADSATDSAPETEQDISLQEVPKHDIAKDSTKTTTTATCEAKETEMKMADVVSPASIKCPMESLPEELPDNNASAELLPEDPISPEDAELVIDEDVKTSEDVASQVSSKSKPQPNVIESPQKDADLRSPKPDLRSPRPDLGNESDDKSPSKTPLPSKSASTSDTEPVAWPKTKKQLARQQLSSKTLGKLLINKLLP